MPGGHLLRRLDAALNLSWLRAELAPFYSAIGRPWIDPELMIRMLLVGHCYGVHSERRLCDEVHLNLGYRWFCRLGLDGAVPDHSTFSRARHGRFREAEVFRRVFEAVVGSCMTAGLVGTNAMGITPPSLYAAFGDKKHLFLEAVRLYAGNPQQTEQVISAAPSAREAARGMLRGSAFLYTGEDTPAGCLLASATASGSAASAEVQAAVAEVRRAAEDALRRRIEADIAAGHLPAATSAQALASLTLAVIQGMSVLARDGTPRAKLLALADQALQAWPLVSEDKGTTGVA